MNETPTLEVMIRSSRLKKNLAPTGWSDSTLSPPLSNWAFLKVW